jgi:hypothetical protein
LNATRSAVAQQLVSQPYAAEHVVVDTNAVDRDTPGLAQQL